MSTGRTRPTRDETRERLFEAAAQVFVREGIAGASIGDIAAEAGLTRGAFYSNFADKDELVLAMLSDHLDRSVTEVERLAAEHTDAGGFLSSLESDERRREGPLEDLVLQMEFILHSLRSPAGRRQLVERRHRWKGVVTAMVERAAAESGRPYPFPVDEVADFVVALDDGYMLQELIEPGSYRPGAVSATLRALNDMWLATAPPEE